MGQVVMKHNLAFIAVVGVLAVFGLLGWFLWDANESLTESDVQYNWRERALLTKVKREVEIIGDDGNWYPALVGSVVKKGTRLRTKENSHGRIKLSSGTSIVLDQHTTLRLTELRK